MFREVPKVMSEVKVVEQGFSKCLHGDSTEYHRYNAGAMADNLAYEEAQVCDCYCGRDLDHILWAAEQCLSK